jgi:hypothetical protein
MKKPEILYVAAKTRGIKELIPQKGRYRNLNEGAVVFSTPDKALASIFLINNHDDIWVNLGYFNDIPYVVINKNKEQFMEQDKGGSIYEVSSDTFDFDPNLGMKEKEWTSYLPVKTLKENYYDSSLETMIENGVNVYFVDNEQFNEIKNTRDHGLNILNSLVSENEKQNRVLKPLPHNI